MNRPIPDTFRAPSADAPLDVEQVLRAIPANATMTGLFLAAVVREAARVNVRLPSARERYGSFRPYPLREHAELLVQAAQALWPTLPIRTSLRKLGRGAPRTLVQSMVGRVVLGSVEGPMEILRAMAKSYPIHSQPGTLEVVELAPGRAVVRMQEIHHFLDSHHVGVFEGVLRWAQVQGTVRIHPYSRVDADLLCEWKAG